MLATVIGFAMRTIDVKKVVMLATGTRAIFMKRASNTAASSPVYRKAHARMSLVVVKAKRIIDVSPGLAFSFLVDFNTQHPKILPRNFSNYRVEVGGIGTGTVIAYCFRAGKRVRDYRMSIEADEARHRIVERDQGSSLTTTWDLVPLDDGARTSVEIATTWDGAAGIGGFFERTFAPLVLRRVYRDELSLLASALK